MGATHQPRGYVPTPIFLKNKDIHNILWPNKIAGFALARVDQTPFPASMGSQLAEKAVGSHHQPTGFWPECGHDSVGLDTVGHEHTDFAVIFVVVVVPRGSIC